MTLEEENKIIDDLIGEDDNNTILDFINLKQDVELIEKVAQTIQPKKPVKFENRKVLLLNSYGDSIESELFFDIEDLERIKRNWKNKHKRLYNESQVIVI
jgi:tRNA A58 N-methylase Trm61